LKRRRAVTKRRAVKHKERKWTNNFESVITDPPDNVQPSGAIRAHRADSRRYRRAVHYRRRCTRDHGQGHISEGLIAIGASAVGGLVALLTPQQ